MFGISSRIFRSRWAALLWAGGILWTAWSIAGTGQSSDSRPDGDDNQTVATDATGAPVSDADMAVIAGVLDGTGK